MISHSKWMTWFLGLMMIGHVNGQSDVDAVFPFYGEFGPGARAMALGGAYSALAEDFTATYWNPAGLAQIRKMEFYGSMSQLRVTNQIEYQGTTTENTNGFNQFNALGAVFPVPTFRGSLVFAIGYNRVNQYDDFNVVEGYPDPGNGRRFYQNHETTVVGGLGQWTFAGAVDLTENMSLGATLNILSGKNNHSIRYYADDRSEDADPPLFIDGESIEMMEDEANIEYNPDYSGVSFKIGSLFRPIENLRIGLTVSTPAYVRVEENSIDAETIRLDDSTYIDLGGEAFRKYRLTSPWRFEIGAAYKYRWFTGSGSVEFVDWTQTRFESSIIDDEGRDIDNAINRSILSDYRATTIYRLGGEFVVPALGAKLMAGYMHHPSPYKASVEEVNSDRNYLSAGVSFLVDKQVKIDMAYQHGWWKRSTVDSYLGQDINGNYFETHDKMTTNRFLVSLSYRF